MPVQLNHTIVHASDREATARFLTEILGLPDATPYGPFLVVQVDNDVSLDVVQDSSPISAQHYAFLVSEDDFDVILGRIKERGLDHWADPFTGCPVGSTPTTVAAASTGTTSTGTTSRSSRDRTAAESPAQASGAEQAARGCRTPHSTVRIGPLNEAAARSPGR